MKTQDQIIAELKVKKYEEGITLLTVTCDRQVCITKTFQYILRGICQANIQWLVVDDGTKPAELPQSSIIQHIKRQNIKDKAKSFLGNLREAIVNVRYNKVLILEDDDWYSPDYIRLYSQRLDNFQLIGEAPARYYNVKHRCWRTWGNNNRASFCQTAFRAELLPTVYICTHRGTVFVDYRLWEKDVKSKFIFKDACHCVGIKGMPGRSGIGAGHRPNIKKYHSDKDMNELEKWIGKEDTDFYRSVYK